MNFTPPDEAVLATALGDDDAAAAHAREAASVAERLQDPALRRRALVDAELARGAVLLERDPRAAGAALTRAIEGYEQGEKALFLPECHLLRGRAKRALHDVAGAKANKGGAAAAYVTIQTDTPDVALSLKAFDDELLPDLVLKDNTTIQLENVGSGADDNDHDSLLHSSS